MLLSVIIYLCKSVDFLVLLIKNKNITLRDESVDTKTNVFRQLLNQKTLIRISWYIGWQWSHKGYGRNKRKHESINNSIRQIKKYQAWKSIYVRWKQRTRRLKNKPESSRILAWSFCVQYKPNLNDKIKEFDKNTSMILYSIKICLWIYWIWINILQNWTYPFQKW